MNQPAAAAEQSDMLSDNAILNASETEAILELFEESSEEQYSLDEVNQDLNDLLGIGNVSDAGDSMLDDLLRESMQAKKEADLAKEARKRLHMKDSKLNKSEKDALQTAIRSYEAKREWFAQADVALFNVQHCTHCGTDHSHFAGLYQRQLSRFTSVTRWVRATAEQNKTLPKETRTDVSYISMCGSCLDSFGYPQQT